MSDSGNTGGEMLSHILNKLETIEGAISSVKVDIASIRAQGLSETVKSLTERITAIEIKSASWSGAAGTGAAVGRWAAGIIASLITGAIGAAIGWLLHR